jgi:hypothetical protein
LPSSRSNIYLSLKFKDRVQTASIYKNPFTYVFYALVLFYILVYGPYGLEDGDNGTVFSISWSMYHGVFPYRDFVYIKPPMSPYFHSLPLYISEEFAYLFNRMFYYVQVFSYSLILSHLACKMFTIKRRDIVYFIAIVGALISIHNYPPMPWNTIDGVFFSAIGIYFLFQDKKTWWKLLLAAFFVSLGVLCKQSFYFFPVFITVYLLFTKQFKTTAWFIGFGLLFAASFLGVLYANGALELFFEQMFSFTSGSSFWRTGFHTYYMGLKTNFLIVAVMIIIVWLLKKLAPQNLVYIFVQLVIAAILIYLFVNEDPFHTVKQSIIQTLFVFSVFFSVWSARRNTAYWFLLLLLSLGWCASISNGFNTPIDVSTPIVFAIFMFVFSTSSVPFRKSTGFVVIALYVVTFYIGYQNIYMDSDRKELTYDMGEVYPQLATIKSDKETFDKYTELKTLSQQQTNYTVLPSVTLAHYLTETVNPIGIDWVFNHHIADRFDEYIAKLEDNNVTVLLENDFETSVNNYEEESLLTLYVRDNCELVSTPE